MIHSEYKEDVDKLNDYIEPVFYFGLNKDRKLPAHISPSHAANNFEYHLKKKPNDLSCHLQRIQFCISCKNRTELFTALCDLFIILGTQGLALRQRLFASCKPALNHEQIEFLQSSLTEKKLTAETEALPDNCFFKKQPFELLELKTHSTRETKTPEDVLHIAESYIENSQFDTALEYMQTHLEQNPKNKALTLKLISLFKALGCADKFHKAYEKFSKNVTTSLYWNDARQKFSNQ